MKWHKTEPEEGQGTIQVSFSSYLGHTDQTPSPADPPTAWRVVMNKPTLLRWTKSPPAHEPPLFLTDVPTPFPAPELTVFLRQSPAVPQVKRFCEGQAVVPAACRARADGAAARGGTAACTGRQEKYTALQPASGDENTTALQQKGKSLQHATLFVFLMGEDCGVCFRAFVPKETML